MQRPSWLVGVVLLMLAIILSTHMFIVVLATRRCAEVQALLLDKWLETAPPNDKAEALTKKDEMVRERCQDLREDFNAQSNELQATLLALLGGAALGMGGKRPDQ